MLKSIKIGSLTINPIILAPMSGITDFPFRTLVKQFGAGLVVSEMVASRAMILRTQKSMQRAKLDNDSYIQLVGYEPDVIAESARMCVELGAKMIDINLGCPAKKIVNNYSGVALMKNEKLVYDICSAVVRAVEVPITVKMRLGVDKENINVCNIAQIAEHSGVKMLTIHARTGSQFYTGYADWQYIACVKKCVKIPVIANGDIVSVSSAIKCLSISGADGIMIGRAALGRPWLLAQIMHSFNGNINAEFLSTKLVDIVIKHYNNILDYYGHEVGMRIARKHISWYSSSLSNAASFRSMINSTTDPDIVRSKIIDFFHLKKVCDIYE